ncbi:diaminopimelate epimerase [bacterium (Candidatus Blackallbacteria) CG17_big_fil_post_rev_8_21_14_2_50_48_46]|uniref:Diaminopimelate epimerase n=1 Tax=bacterium (Candidatus Blackallbacteria) CG17_big_fil_post_rev_8_21_14_2_50_48_46 TaxID=2014261 RepID=A0A2M7GAR0_9BACT|nr:MAG: diaminopimelate epimerase [bacterium (Candidatus Blackallbacteria) CG18_big_fil_WC_8_21_14_2_50_49_26]PIW19237.1 MAG: diaminopimelate epimerase [bacterium (Candidatus Blackallbacteria) CG17_big_fil_post_rev_8_21_14_2_50_48_46]PIW45503.1 MAG: diaminopimelate epimerase [bacterium (Candidatus Blackallbacteria) CG13_big_fil_rev_8_21_14_2_50_49_14]
MQIPFQKFQGLGNDFVILEARDLPFDLDLSRLAQKLCNRHFGIGADGLLICHRESRGDARMQVINSDGSEPEMCGNGLRCFVRYLAGHEDQSFLIETGAGLLKAEFSQKKQSIRVNMGKPVLSPAKIPALGWNETPVVSAPLQVENHSFEITLVSMGNPHCVIEVDQNWSSADTLYWGPLLEMHPAFPERINIEFTQFLTPHLARVSVWERGAGATLACGTGACATLVAGVLQNKLETEAVIQLPGGDLTLFWDQNQDQVWMDGPAQRVFTGSYEEEGMIR